MNINQIAELAGVSKRSVTRALNGQDGLSEKTRQKILDVAEKHHYHPSTIARALTTKRTNTLALIIPENDNMFFAALTRAVEETAWEHGFNIILINTCSNVEKEVRGLNLCREKLMDGILITPTSTESNATLAELKKMEIPFVLLNRRYQTEDNFDYVVNDNRHGAILAMTHLLEHGYRDIVMVNSDIHASSSLERLAGYREALSRYHLEGHRVVNTVASIAGGEAAAGKFSAARMPEAIFTFNDLIAAGIYRNFKQRGIRIGADVALVGYDNIELASFLEPQLTTVFQPTHEIGRAAAEILLHKIKNGDAEPQRRVYPPSLVVRASCGCGCASR